MKENGGGTIGWTDLTVSNAAQIRDFYRAVVGWETAELEMGGYNDYCMIAPSNGKTVAGICHARGVNAGLPAPWLIYIAIENLDQSSARCVELGGKILAGPNELGDGGRFCVIQDPAGAVAALFEQAE
jgi:predicted enzyme related to lactoylglutathione lyase